MNTDSESNGATFLGACVIDLIMYVKRFPKIGETVVGKKFLKGFGGKSANAAVLAARLGLNVRMLCKIGDDQFGDETIKNLKENGINSDNVFRTSESHTAAANIVVNDQGQNTVAYTTGASDLLTVDEINLNENLFFNNINLFTSTFECRPETLLHCLKIAKSRQIMTFVNAAPPFANEFDLKNFHNCIDLICINETEAELLTGQTINSFESAISALKAIIHNGWKSAIITLGADGCIYLSSENIENILHVKTIKVETIDTCGAGDSFVGALSYYLVKEPNLPMEEKLRRSCYIASLTTTKCGTQASYPMRSELPVDLFSN